MERDVWLEELENFLGGTFHQDINSPEEALNDYINEVGGDWLRKIVQCAEMFMFDNKMSLEEKNKYIISNTDIYFPAMNLTPFQWFQNIINVMKQSLK